MTNKNTVLLLGLVVIALCASFPPRRYAGNTISMNHSTVAPRSFLWHPNVHRLGMDGNSTRLEIDMPKLLAEIVIFASVTGIAFLYVRND